MQQRNINKDCRVLFGDNFIVPFLGPALGYLTAMYSPEWGNLVAFDWKDLTANFWKMSNPPPLAGIFFAHSGGQRGVIFHEKKYSQNSAWLVKKIICLIFNKLTDLLIWATNLEARAPQLKCLGSPKAPWKFSLEYSLAALLLSVEVHFVRTSVKECKF